MASFELFRIPLESVLRQKQEIGSNFMETNLTLSQSEEFPCYRNGKNQRIFAIFEYFRVAKLKFYHQNERKIRSLFQVEKLFE